MIAQDKPALNSGYSRASSSSSPYTQLKEFHPFPGLEFPYLHDSLCYIMCNLEDKQTEKVISQPTWFLNSVHAPAAQTAPPAQAGSTESLQPSNWPGMQQETRAGACTSHSTDTLTPPCSSCKSHPNTQVCRFMNH